MKRYKKFYFGLIFINVVFVAIIVCFCLHFYKNITLKNEKFDNFVSDLVKNFDKSNYDINSIKQRILLIEESVENNSILINKIDANNYKNDIALINAKIENIENSKPEEEKLKFTIIKTLNTILKKYYNNQRFDIEIKNLNVLCKNNEFLLKNINKLENYLNISIKSVLDTFDTEAKNLVIDSENTLLKNLIKIKKISDKNVVKLTNAVAKEIRLSITNNDFETAVELINKNNYQDKLVKTIELIHENQNFLNLLDSIVQSI